ALRAGASGFLLKDTPPAQLLDAVRVVASGEALLAPTVTRRLISERTRRHRSTFPTHSWTKDLPAMGGAAGREGPRVASRMPYHQGSLSGR
ncbi:MAG: hypothetical protein ACRDRO_07140, partial [Pseudonocardiaceae bacterium]